MIVERVHSDQRWLLNSLPEGLVGSQGSNDHLSDSVEDSSFPILIVWPHLFVLLVSLLDSAVLNTLQVHVTDVVIILDQIGDNLLSMHIEVLRERRYMHRVFSVELDLSDNNGIFDVHDLLLNVLGVLDDSTLNFLELVNGLLAVDDVLRNRKREPVVVFSSLVHPPVQLVDLLSKELLGDWHELAESAVVASEQLVELINVSHVVLLLEGDVGDSLWDGLTNSVEELGFSDDDLELWGEVNKVSVNSSDGLLLQDEFLKELNSLVGVLLFPVLVDLGLVSLVKKLSELDVLLGNSLTSLRQKLFWLGLKLVDWSLNSSHDTSGPGNSSSLWWHVL